MGGKSSSQKVYDYYMSIDYGVCHGPIDAYNEVIVKDKSAFVGPVTADAAVYISEEDLFGGKKGEGGVKGIAEFYLGGWQQKQSAELAARDGRTPDTAPGYRGLAHVFFRGGELTDGTSEDPDDPEGGPVTIDGRGVKLFGSEFEHLLGAAASSGPDGFRWITNNPYLPATKIHVTVGAAGLDGFEFIYPIIGTETVTTGSAPGDVDILPDPGQATLTKLGNNNPSLGSFVPGYKFASWNWNSSSYAAFGLTLPFGDKAGVHNDAIPGELVIDVCLDEVPNGKTVTYSDSLVLVGSVGSVTNKFQIQTWDGSTFNTIHTTNKLETGTAAIPRSFSFVKTSTMVGVRITLAIESTWDYAWNRTAYVGSPYLGYYEPNDSRREVVQWVRAAPGDAFSDGRLDKTKLPDANPAAIIYETLTNADWGKGDLPAACDIDSFLSAAQTYDDEGMGISILYTGQDSVENFCGEVLDHCKSVLFEHPKTGLWTLRPIRGGYSTDGIPRFNPRNVKLTAIKTRQWHETINEVVVSYTNPENEETETVSAEHHANIAILGGVKSDARDYYGFRNPFIGQFVAERDLAEASRTLTTASLTVDRTAFDLLPGDVAWFDWPDEEIESMLVRIINIDYGSSADQSIKLEIAEDVFANGVPTIQRSPQVAPPANLDIPEDPDRVLIMGTPLPLMIAGGGDVAAIDAEYPVTSVLFHVADADFVPIEIEIQGTVTQPNGSSSLDELTTILATPFAPLGTDLVAEANSVLPSALVRSVYKDDPVEGALFVIGNTEADHELVMLDTYDAVNNEWSVIRGVYDTVPTAWTTTDLFWRFEADFDNVDPGSPVDGVAETYYLLPRTYYGKLAVADATPVVYIPNARPHQPFRPANCSIDGNGFAHTEYTSGATPATITLTWENRNRKSEDAVAMTWTGGNVTPETGQTTTVRFRETTGSTVVHELTGLTGTSTVVDTTLLQSFRNYDVEFSSDRDGFTSYRTVVRTLAIGDFGWGFNWDKEWSENDGGF